MSLASLCTLATYRIAQQKTLLQILLNRTEQFLVKRRLTTIFTSLNPPLSIEKSIRGKKISVDPRQQLEKIKVIGFKVTEDELQNIIYTR
jgi:hypothetical protein